ncbi:MAG: site-2 protease family protein [Candidatus Pacebacteria bacterium]|jgi:Zn-dependent protease|nr:site-2 protease family protein [Candidatus Paceibacterota bacterium]
MAEFLALIFSIIALIFSVVIHEIAHGAVANSLGDPTAKFAGRLTLNPISHLDLVGSFLLPLFMLLIARATGAGFIIGYAKPVPINPFNLRDKKFGEAKVAVAGVAANFGLALVFGLILRGLLMLPVAVNPNFYDLLGIVVNINLTLMIFNLMPIPPLDGSHILFTFLPRSQEDFKIFLQRNYLIFMLIFLVVLLPYVSLIVDYLFYLITGVRIG